MPWTLLAQTSLLPEDIAEVIRAASNKSWEAAMLAVIMVAVCSCLAFLVKSWMTQASIREERMAKRIDLLEGQVFGELKEALVGSRTAMEQNTAAFNKLSDALANRPCFWSAEKQREMVRDLKGEP